jgi:hypothetical protein
VLGGLGKVRLSVKLLSGDVELDDVAAPHFFLRPDSHRRLELEVRRLDEDEGRGDALPLTDFEELLFFSGGKSELSVIFFKTRVGKVSLLSGSTFYLSRVYIGEGYAIMPATATVTIDCLHRLSLLVLATSGDGDTDRIVSISCRVDQGGQGKCNSGCRLLLSPAKLP